MHEPDLNKILGQSTDMLTNYHQLIVDSPEFTIKPDGLSNIANMLADTQRVIQKEMDENSVTHIKPDKLKQMDEAIDKFLKDPTTVNKIQAVQSALHGNSFPFFNQLRSVQALLRTIESLKKTRGGRASPLEGMDRY